LNDTRCPTVPLNVNAPFCPGVPNGTATAAPPTDADADVSAGTPYSCAVMLPVPDPSGSIKIV
jgi:hypothetical protein